ncbi:MAG: response regulator, partial [Pseudomonadota bacterium]|nr:response regulator [Pseudomonadota bacterium]
AQTGPAQFCLVTGSINFNAARNFATRICRAIASANLVNRGEMHFIASCGVASLESSGEAVTPDEAGLSRLLALAQRRAGLGMQHAFTGVICEQQEARLLRGEPPLEEPPPAAPPVDLATLTQWIKDGNQAQVIDYMASMSAELRPLIELLLKQHPPQQPDAGS